ncbi:MAG: GNAT family N-acetyltransferase, partial [Oscillospiraceae bacterium]|nr:GNAT family N-acetyltransferase [Oscillospiraceae bacterium]
TEITWDALSKNYKIGDFYIAYADDIPAGCMALIDYDPFFWPDVQKGEALFIHKLAVIKAARKSGVADSLIDFAKNECVTRKIPTLRLDCDAMRPKQRIVYERNGFICVGEKKMGVKRVFNLAYYVYTLPNNIKTGWERENRVHFDDIVVNYDKARWNYPDELFADIFEYLGAGHKNALEIGAGTGKATAPMLKAGYEVTAVEMSANMAAFIKDKFKDNSYFNVIVSDFENVVLPENNYDLVYAASAFHWVDAQIGCPKACRLLKRGGTFALFRNNLINGNEPYKEAEEYYEKYYLSIYPKNKSSSPKTRDVLSSPFGINHGYGFSDMEQYGFTDIAMKFYDVTLTYSADEYIALLETMSDHRNLPDSNKAALYTGIRDVIYKHGGKCKQDWLFQLYMGRKM